jgi:hypothetical protein
MKRAPWGSIKSFVARLLPGESIKLTTASQCDNIHHRASRLGRKTKRRKISANEYIITLIN